MIHETYVTLNGKCMKYSPDSACLRLLVTWGYRGEHDEIMKHHIVATFTPEDIRENPDLVAAKLKSINEQIEEHRVRMGVTVPDMQRIVDGEAFFIVEGGFLTKGPDDPIPGCGPYVVVWEND
jgi:hypothetical protein